MNPLPRARPLNPPPTAQPPGSDVSAPATALRIANFTLCQLGWFAAVLGAAKGFEVAGCAVVLAVLAWHLGTAAHPAREAALLLSVTVVGLLAEAAQAQLDAFHYVGTAVLGAPAPLWLLLLWPLLGCMLNVSLRWLHGRYLLAAVCGAFAGPLAFFGGVRLGAAQVYDASTLWPAQAIGWAALMPLFVALAGRLDGIVRRAAAGEAS